VLLKIREQARVQIEGRELKRPVHELLEPIEPEKGLAKLPPPSPADLFLDFESAPYALEQGLEYLIGVVTVTEEAEATPPYQAIWALDRASEKKAFEEFMSWTMARWRASPDMHVYHYAPYEQTAIKRLAGRHSCYVDEVDLLLRGAIFVDLYQVVRQGLRASVESYSIKKMERFYEYTRDQPLRDATLALQSLEAFLSLASVIVRPPAKVRRATRSRIGGFLIFICIRVNSKPLRKRGHQGYIRHALVTPCLRVWL
jgi:uncharacterized protein